MHWLLDFEQAAPRIFKIQTKVDGLIPFKLRKYQKRYCEHLRSFKNGIVRTVDLKPRQSGHSTLLSGINTHATMYNRHEKTLVMADKFDRTMEVFAIYDRFVNNTPALLRPQICTQNTEKICFDVLDKTKQGTGVGMCSELSTESAQDKNAGRSTPRKRAHLSEFAFYPYANEIDDGIKNSIPLAKGTFICKESTAFGMTGRGEAFYRLWEAASNGDTIYKPFFISWHEVDDYAVDPGLGFLPTKAEIEILKMNPDISSANLMWRRLKLQEYGCNQNQIFTPEEMFQQDFPTTPTEAFLSSGRPVFNHVQINRELGELKKSPPPRPKIKIERPMLSTYGEMLKVFFVPEKDKRYAIGADVAEGVAQGDSSSACVIDDAGRQCAVFHGHLDPDHFGEVLVDIAKVYNEATIAPEINSMGAATLAAIKRRGYFKLYRRSVYDEVAKKMMEKLGWRTTRSNKQLMLSHLVSAFRDGEVTILDERLLREMLGIARESDGDVELTGQDRIVAMCLALIAREQNYRPGTVTLPFAPVKVKFENVDKFRETMIDTKQPSE